MKKLILPVTVFIAGLLVADRFFDMDIPKLFRGFGNFLLHIVKGNSQ